jgi:hypothetical protein
MKYYILILLTFLTITSNLRAQVKFGHYIGFEVDEWVYSKNQKTHVLLETIELNTQVILSEEKIEFQKGEDASWLGNKWEFDDIDTTDDGTVFYRYLDERDQMVLITPKNNFLYYYYNWDNTFENFRNLTVYKNLELTGKEERALEDSKEQIVLGKFIITDAKFNGEDVTPKIVMNKGYTVFYTFKGDEELYMANYFTEDETQSFGLLYDSNLEEFEETEDEYKTEVLTSSWRYINDYDENKGTAKIKFTKTYKPLGIIFELTILAEDLDFMVYKGYMEGSLDFSFFK